MKKEIPLILVFLGTASLYGQLTVTEPIPKVATIDIDSSAVQQRSIPRTIFGTFLEPIGNSTYNGLWAEVLQNPSLEEGLWSAQNVTEMLRERPELRRASELSLPLPWEPLNGAQGNRYEVHSGDAANSWLSLKVFAVPGKTTGIKQKIYLPIHRTPDYVGSFYARHLSGNTTILVALCLREQDTILASQQIEAADSAWKKYTFTLHVPEGKLHHLDPADFVLQLTGDERIELDEFSLRPADAQDGFDPDAVKLSKEMRSPLVRFGGNFTSSYHWSDGIGPHDKRISMRNNSWGIPEYNTFGTDEFLEYCRLIGADPQFALNMGSGTPQEAADWVRYIEEHWTTHSGLLFELGNELWGNWNLGYPTREELAKRTLDFSKAVRAVDPHARLIATGGDPDRFKDWNAIQLTNAPETFDYLSTHFVVGAGNVQLNNAPTDFVSAAAWALPIEIERRLHDVQGQIDNTPGYNGKTHLALTEWLFAGRHAGTPSFTNTGGAVFTGGILNMLMRNADTVPISDMTGIMEFAGIWKKRSQVYATPAYYVFKMYASADADNLVSSTANAGTYSVSHGVERLPDIAAVPYLDVIAALSQDGKRLSLFCVNRSLDTDIPAAIRLHQFAASGKAKVQLLTSASMNDINDEIDPAHVQVVENFESTTPDGWSHTFPHASVTVISVDRQ